jgi:hypothetical protein
VHPHLSHQLHRHTYLRARLLEEFIDLDEDTLRDTLEGLTTLPELLAEVVRSYLDDLMLVAALDMRIAEMQQRSLRFEQRAEKKRACITLVMEQADVKKLAQPDFTASLRSVPPAVVVTDETQIPTDFWKPQPPKLDRQGLAGALKAGVIVAGAILGNPQVTVSVRRK